MLETRTEGYEFIQSSASVTWTIVHNRGTLAPVVDAWVDDGFGNTIKIYPSSVNVIDANTVVLTFSTARIGTARVI